MMYFTNSLRKVATATANCVNTISLCCSHGKYVDIEVVFLATLSWPSFQKVYWRFLISANAQDQIFLPLNDEVSEANAGISFARIF